MKAAADFALCGRTPKSCSRHSDCARAQLTSGNPQRQSFVWSRRTGAACALFYNFAPFRQLAANGGGIADTLAESENLGRSVTAGEATASCEARILTRPANTGAAARETAGESDSANTLGAARSARAVGQNKYNRDQRHAAPGPDSFRRRGTRRVREGIRGNGRRRA